jgi:hypothetical protein
MKFVISLFFSISAFASPIHVFYEDEPSRAEVVRTIFIGDYKIPESLISLKEVSSCEALQKKGKLDVCLKKNGDLQVVSVDRGFVNESLKIFAAP